MDTLDPFEELADIDLPALQNTHKYSNVADGPFAVEHNGELALGAMLNRSSGGLYLLIAGGMKYITTSYRLKVDKARQTLTFLWPETHSEYVLRPITLADQKFFYPELRFTDLSEFKDYIQRIARNMGGGTDSLSDYAITADDKGRVLGLFMKTTAGFFRREDKGWVKLSKDEADWVDIEDQHWIHVLAGSLRLYDEMANEEVISKSLFKSFIV